MSYDPIKAITIGIMASGTNVLVVPPDLPIHSVKENWSGPHGEAGRPAICLGGHRQPSSIRRRIVLKLTAKATGCHVPFRGRPAPPDSNVVGGHTSDVLSLVRPRLHPLRQLRALRRRAKRSRLLPDLPPTIA